MTVTAPPLAAEVEDAVGRLRPVEVAVGVLTYNNADTVAAVVAAARAGLEQHGIAARAALISVDADSADETRDVVAAGGLPVVAVRSPAPITERSAVPFHGVPGRSAALRTTIAVAHRLGVRALVLLEADVSTARPDWITLLAGPVLEDKADVVMPAYARHRYDGTMTKLLLGPLVSALIGRRVQQPFGGQQALSGRLLEHLLGHPRPAWSGRDVADLWVLATAVADGFAVWEAWLGAHGVRSRTRSGDLPTMAAQTLGAVFGLMERHPDLWQEARRREALPAVGEPAVPSADPVPIDVERMLDGFRRGLRDLTPIWEHVLAPETLGEVLALDVPDPGRFRFPDPLWARVVYDFALGHHYGVVHRDHLLRSLVPLYLGRTAAFIVATRDRSAAASQAALEGIGTAFEREKPYLVERWT